MYSRREMIKINKIRVEKGDFKAPSNEISNGFQQRINMEYLEKLYSKKLKYLEEMDTFLNLYDLPKLNQEDVNKPIYDKQ
jgi:hypothetical protein